MVSKLEKIKKEHIRKQYCSLPLSMAEHMPGLFHHTQLHTKRMLKPSLWITSRQFTAPPVESLRRQTPSISPRACRMFPIFSSWYWSLPFKKLRLSPSSVKHPARQSGSTSERSNSDDGNWVNNWIIFSTVSLISGTPT